MPLLTINSSGLYHITADYTATGPTDDAIRIAPGVHYVTILLYSRLVGASGPASLNSGIFWNGNAAINVIGMGGSIRGFQYGARGENTNISSVRDVFIQDAFFRGIVLNGPKARITDNIVQNVGGCTAYPNAYCMGIETQGITTADNEAIVCRNVVQEVYGVGAGESVGISLSDKCRGAILKDNVVKNKVMRAGSFGLWVGGDSDPSGVGNHFEGFAFGAAFSSVPTGFLDENTFRNCGQNILHQNNIVIGPGDQPDAI